MADPGPAPVDRLLGGYLLLTAAALLFPDRPAAWPLLLALHALAGAFLLAGGMGRIRAAAEEGARGRGLSALRIVTAWYPLLLMPLLYLELPQLIGSVWDGRFFDGAVLGWEARLFGHQPSATLASRWDSMLLSEALHLAYLSYYPIIYIFPAALYISARRDAFAESLFALMLGFTVSYVCFIAFPVQGPRYLFPAPGGAASEGWLYTLTHGILEAGSSRGAAFPSAHMAVAVVQTMNAVRYLPAAVPVLGLLTAGIGLGAVYGGFHYAVDMIAGAALGAAVAATAPRAWRALS